jgi:hypothetical protein
MLPRGATHTLGKASRKKRAPAKKEGKEVNMPFRDRF